MTPAATPTPKGVCQAPAAERHRSTGASVFLECDVMIPTHEHRRPLALAAALCPLFIFACGRVPGQFEILNNQVPAASGGCSVPINPTVYEGTGTLDLSIVRSDFTTAYFFFPLIENNLPASTGGGLDSNQIQLSGFNVDIKPSGTASDAVKAVFASPDASPYLHFQVPWSGGVSSGGGQLSASVAAFPVPLAQQLLAQGGIGAAPSLTVNLRVQAIGVTNSGTSMQSDPFDYPVQVCAGCLVQNVQPCPFLATPANLGNACNPAQDQVVDCCTDNGALICPPTVAAQ
jgi:hypothetical protein